MSDTLHENIYDNLPQKFNSHINGSNEVNVQSEQIDDVDSEYEVVLRDRKDSVEIKTNRQRHKKHKSWNQRKLNEINSKYFDEDNDTNCDELSDKENERLSQKVKRSKSVGFVLKTDQNSDDSFETAEEAGTDEEFGYDVILNDFSAQVQNHYYPSSSSSLKTSSPYEQNTGANSTVLQYTSNEKTYIPISNDDPESYSEGETDNELSSNKKKIGWNPPSPPPTPFLPRDINQPNESSPSRGDVSSFLQKKSLAQGMMDLALLSANTNQLRYILDSRNTHPYYITSLSLVCFSLVLQILVGLSLIWNSQYNVRKKSELKTADRLNNFSVVGVFLISITNVFISTFGGSTSNQSDNNDTDYINDSNVSLVENFQL